VIYQFFIEKNEFISNLVVEIKKLTLVRMAVDWAMHDQNKVINGAWDVNRYMIIFLQVQCYVSH